jgi:hypothetical protein
MMPEFTYSPETLRYRNVATGRFVAESTVRAGVDAVADLTSEKMAALSGRLLSGGVTLAEWETQARQLIKDAHVATGIAAKGGKAMMAPADWLVIAREVKTEYRFLHGMAEDIASGKQPLDGRLTARSRQYGQAARGTHAAMTGRERRNSGFRFERNILSAGACSGCQAESARGLVPIGTLIPVGSRLPCRANCRCRLAYEMAEVA